MRWLGLIMLNRFIRNHWSFLPFSAFLICCFFSFLFFSVRWDCLHYSSVYASSLLIYSSSVLIGLAGWVKRYQMNRSELILFSMFIRMQRPFSALLVYASSPGLVISVSVSAVYSVISRSVTFSYFHFSGMIKIARLSLSAFFSESFIYSSFM